MNRASRFLLFVTIASCIPLSVYSQIDTTWTMVLGIADIEEASSLTKTNDGNVVVAGQYVVSREPLNVDQFISKHSVDGLNMWTSTFDISTFEIAKTIAETNDNRFLVGGQASVTNEEYGRDIYTGLIDSVGNQSWTHRFGMDGNSYDVVSDCIQTSTGKYLYVGNTRPGSTEHSAAWLQLVSQTGSVEWTKIYENPANWQCKAVIETEDGGFLTVGSPLLMKFNSSGDSLWSRRSGIGDFDFGLGIRILTAPDGNFLILSHKRDEVTDEHKGELILIDSSGDVIWSKLIDDQDEDRYATYSDITESHNEGYLLLGSHDDQPI